MDLIEDKMRWQWRDMVRTLDWEAMEKLARTDPNQQICDTVHELSQGLDNKTDVRRAKRVLYFLKQEGFTPTPPEGHEHPFDPPTNTRYGFIGTIAQDGYSEVGVVVCEKGKMKWLNARINLAAGCMLLRTQEFPSTRNGEMRYQLFHRERDDIYAAEAPADYCLRHIHFCMKICKILERSKGLDSWLELLKDLKTPEQHPSDEAGTLPASSEVCRTLWKTDPKSAGWKFWLHHAKHAKLIEALRSLDKSSTKEERLKVFQDHRDLWLDRRCVIDGIIRFLDHSWALRYQGKVEEARAFLRVGIAIDQQRSDCAFWDSWAEAAAETILEDHAELLTDTKHRLFTGVAA